MEVVPASEIRMRQEMEHLRAELLNKNVCLEQNRLQAVITIIIMYDVFTGIEQTTAGAIACVEQTTAGAIECVEQTTAGAIACVEQTTAGAIECVEQTTAGAIECG